MTKMASLFWLLVALLLLAVCHVQAPVWFTDPATVWIVQAGIILLWLLVARFGFAVQLLAWRFPVDMQEEEAERVFGPLCDRNSVGFWPWRRKKLPWLLVTGQAEQVNALLPGLTEERWQASWCGILLWCGEPGQIADADLIWLKRRRGRRALSAVLWVTDAADGTFRDEQTQLALWRQLKHTGECLGWRLPAYAVVQRADEHEQYDRPHQSAGVCWAPGTQADIAGELKALAPALVTTGMVQVQHNRRWSWLLQLAQDIREGTLLTLAAALQPLASVRSGVLFAGLFVMPPAPPGQHAGYRECSLSPAWYGVLHQASIRRGRRDRLTLRDGLFRGLLVAMVLWCTGMLVSAYLNTRLVSENNALLAQMTAPVAASEQLHQLRELQRRTDTLLYRAREGTPLQLRFGLDQNAHELRRLWSAWQQQSQRLMLNPVMAELTAQLRQYADLPPDSSERRTRATEAYEQLKAYLMLSQPEQAEPAFLLQKLAPLWPSPESHIRPGEWLMLSTDMLRFYSRELPYHPDWRQAPDGPLVAAVRTLLRSQKGLRNSENTLYQSVLQQAMKRHAAISLSDLMAGRDGDGLLYTDATLPGIFTRDAWEQDVGTLIARVAASRQVTTDRVLDDGKTAAVKVLSEEALRTRLIERYFADYAAAWLTFINSIQWQRGATLSDTLDQLSLLGDSQRSPLPPLIAMLRWQAGVGQEGRTAGESLLNSAKQLVTGDNNAGVSGLTRTEIKPTDVVVQTFAPLLALLPAEDGKTSNAPPGELTLQDYLLQVTQVRLLLQQVTTASDPQAGMLALMQEALNSRDSVLSTARSRGALLAASLGQDWSGFAAAAFSEPLDQAWQSVMKPAAAALNGAWQRRVVNSWQEGFTGRYPFVSSASDASVPLLAHFITPQSGVVEQFVSQQLHGLVEKQGDEWVPVASAQQTLTISPAFFDVINLLSRTGRLAFATGAASLRFDIQMRPQRGIMETTLQLDDAVLKYFNQQAEWRSFRWPDGQTASPQAVLSYIPLNQSGDAALPPETVQSFSGPWALIRLLEQSRREQIDGSRWRTSWSGKNGQPLSLILRTESYGGPLDLLKLRGLKLPATVFSADDGGNDEQ